MKSVNNEIKQYIIKIQGSYYLTNDYIQKGILDDNIKDSIIFKTNNKNAVMYLAEHKIFANERCSWQVVEYEEAFKEYEEKNFIFFGNIKYRYSKYLDVKEAITLIEEGASVVCKIQGENILLNKSCSSIPTNYITDGIWRLIKKVDDE